MGFATALRGVARALVGRPIELPPTLLARYPELATARWRAGGLPPRVGGWCLGQASVSAITLWRTIWLARPTGVSEELLLHEIRHVAQFEADRTFAIRYVWESMRRGYRGNRYEIDARDYAAARARPTSDR
jgi:hypothetical protein